MIWFVRHGKTQENAQRVFAGRIDSPLNETGVAQAKNAALALHDYKIDMAFCSPLKRARQTLEEISKYHPNMTITCDDRLIERDDGFLQGQIVDQRDDERWDMKNWDSLDLGESIHSVYNRVKDFLDEINTKYPDKNVLIVSHYGVGRIVSCYFNGFPKDGNLKNIHIHNADILQFDNALKRKNRKTPKMPK